MLVFVLTVKFRNETDATATVISHGFYLSCIYIAPELHEMRSLSTAGNLFEITQNESQ